MGEIFHTRPDQPWGPTFLPKMCTGSLLKLTIFVGLYDIPVFIIKDSSIILVRVRKHI